MVMVLLSVASGLPLPLLPVQLLWLNLVTNGIQDVALVFEPGEGDTLRRKPRPPREPMFNRLMIERIIVAVVVVGGLGFGAFAWMLDCGWNVDEARNVLLLLLVLFENFHIGNCRSETRSVFFRSPLKSPMLFFGAVGALLLHVISMHLPLMQDVLGVQPVSLMTWVAVTALAVTVVPVMELHKWTWRRRYGIQASPLSNTPMA